MSSKLTHGESILLRRGAFVSVTGLAGVVVIFATTSGAMTEGMQWPVAEIAIMGLALAALPVAFFASRLRLGLEPGEARPMRLRTADYWVPRLIGLLMTPFLSLATSFVIWRIHQRSGIDDYATEVILAPSQWVFVVGAGLATFLGYQFLFEGAAGKLNSLFLTDRRLIRFTPGFWSGRVETLALEDVAEIRENPRGVTLIAASRDAMRRLRPDGSTEPAGIERLDLRLSRFRFPWAAKSQHDRVIALLGRAPLRWHAPVLPGQVERLVSLEAKYWDIVAVLAVIPMLVFLVVAFSTPDTPRIKEAVAIYLLGTLGIFIFGAIGYCLFLWLAARRLSPEDAALFLRASFHPDWAPGRWPQKTYMAARRAALKRRERIASWLAGRPVPFENAPGPEASGGGWRE